MSRKTNSQQPVSRNAVFSFEAPEFVARKRGFIWYASAIAFLALMVFYGFFSGAWTFSLALLVFAGAHVLIRQKEPKTQRVIFSKDALHIDDTAVPYEELKGFWIQEESILPKKLFLIREKRFVPEIEIPLGDENPAMVRQYLSPYLEEQVGRSEKFSDILVHLFKL